MAVMQLAVFVENAPGRLKALTKVLGDHKINMRAVTIADTSDYGIIRLIVDNNELALKVLQENHFVVKLTNVLAIEVGDEPGKLLEILDLFELGQINIEYMYAFKISKDNKALIILKVDKEEEATKLLANHSQLGVLNQEDIMQAF